MAKGQTKQQPAQQPAPEQPKAGVPATGQENAPLILVGDKQDLSHIKQGQVRGNENVQAEDLVIPRLEVLQALSPHLDPTKPEYNQNAKQGDLVNSVTNEIYGREVFVVPVFYLKQWLVWKDRKMGGGFNGAFPMQADAEAKVAELGGKAQGFESIDTPTHFCLLINPMTNKVEEIILSMPRTKAKVSRAWNSMVRLTELDRFARVYRVSSAPEQNAKGTFQNFVISSVGAPNKNLYARAEALYQQISAGHRKVVMDVKGYEATDEGADTGANEM